MALHTPKQMLDFALAHGFTDEGIQGNGHRRLRHSSGEIVWLPSSPSDWRGLRNTEAAMRRIAGVRDDKPRSGRYKRTRGSGFSIEVAQREQATRHTGLQDKQARLDEVDREICTLSQLPANQIDRHHAKVLIDEKKHLEEQLSRMNR